MFYQLKRPLFSDWIKQFFFLIEAEGHSIIFGIFTYLVYQDFNTNYSPINKETAYENFQVPI